MEILFIIAAVICGIPLGMALTVWHNGKVVRNGGHCACACDKGCC